jgi:hypothetical protein
MGLYVYQPGDGSWFGIDGAVIVDVPDDIQDADAVEEFIQKAAPPACIEIQKLLDDRNRTMTDPQRMLWRDDVEGICPNADSCFDGITTARCGPCAIKQAEAHGIVPNLGVPNLPEVYRLRKELAKLRGTEDA